MRDTIITPQTHPKHPVVGKYFGGHNHRTNDIGIFYCDSHNAQDGFWMTNAFDPNHQFPVSEAAIGRTFHHTVDEGEHWFILQWDRMVTKDGKVIPAYGQPGWNEYLEARAQTRSAALEAESAEQASERAS